jgi:DNA-binding transcriptional LysR family regulator
MKALDDLSVFLAVVDGEGFAAVARKLGITTAGASKTVLRLEQRAGTRLFTQRGLVTYISPLRSISTPAKEAAL